MSYMQRLLKGRSSITHQNRRLVKRGHSDKCYVSQINDCKMYNLRLVGWIS